MKKLISVFLVMALVLTNFQGWECLKKINLFEGIDLFQGLERSFAETGTLLEGTGLYYTISNDEVIITDADTSISGDLVIPETINGYPVTSIGDYAFKECSDLINIDIPERVTSIGHSAFWECKKLEEINLPKGLKNIDIYTFYNCNAISNISIPIGVTSIGDNAFSGCSNLKSINIPAGVTKISSFVFSGCKSLEKIDLPEGVKSIEYGAFYNCSAISDISIPEGVINIGDSAFRYCISLNTINVSNKNKKYCSIDGILFDKDMKNIIKYPPKKMDKSYSIPEGIMSIGNNTFEGCCNLESISIPEDVTSIGSSAFEECNLLSGSIDIPKGVTSIENNTFRRCSSLNNINIPEGVTSIGNNAFEGCGSLEIIELPESITSIGSFAFKYCSKLKSIKIPEGITDIKNGMFDGCRSLEIIELPNRLTNIGSDAFASCSKLKSIKIPEGVTSIGSYAFAYCSELSNIIIPKGVTSIENGLFSGCIKLDRIEIPKEVTSIGDFSFFACGSLTIYSYTDSYSEVYAKENNIPFVALDKEILNITFNPDNGEEYINKKVEKDRTLDYTPQMPTKEGYTFVGWYRDIDDITTGYQNNATYEEDITYTAKWAHVQMLGAQGKTIVDDKSGIRFGTKIYDDGDEIIEKGTLIIPVSILGDQKLTLETNQVAKSVAKTLYDKNEEENYVTYLGTLVGIKRAQFGAEITASSYVIYRDKVGNEYTVYSPYKNGSTTINKLLGL